MSKIKKDTEEELLDELVEAGMDPDDVRRGFAALEQFFAERDLERLVNVAMRDGLAECERLRDALATAKHDNGSLREENIQLRNALERISEVSVRIDLATASRFARILEIVHATAATRANT